MPNFIGRPLIYVSCKNLVQKVGLEPTQPIKAKGF